ncbi:MAG: glycosyltransferase family 1 protein [Anaerolineaceae bacterium]|nr:glycosyltransferase family 1 protein [Anaerolineaceae bacterium]
MTRHEQQKQQVWQSPEEIGRAFGEEFALLPPDPTLELAPVKRVAIIAEAFLPKVDGVAKTAWLTLRYLQQTGREVLVFAPDTAPPAVGDSEVIALPSLGLIMAPESRMALPSPAVASRLEEFNPDLIHMFSPALLSVSGMLLGRMRHLPVIANYQTDLPGYTQQYGLHVFSQPMRDWLRFIHNGCHLTLVPSRTTHDQLQAWGYRRLRYWGRGVNCQRFSPENRSAKWRERLLQGRDPDSLVCIYVGRLANEKKVELLLDLARTEGIALTIIGDGHRREELEAIFAGTETYFTGYLLGEDLAGAFASADLFAFTGPNETFGQVVQEAMASGLPAIVIDQGGVKDLVLDGETGIICPADPQAFAAAARRLRDDETLRLNMAARARELALERPWEHIMAALEAHYHEAVAINRRLLRIFPPRGGLNLPLPISFGR